MRYYHFTNRDLDRYVFGSPEKTVCPNNFWTRKEGSRGLCKYGIPSNLEELEKSLGDPGHVIWDYYNKGKFAAEFLMELAFEDVRSNEFSKKPSRKGCIYLFEMSLDPEVMKKKFGFSGRQLVEIEIPDAGEVHVGDLDQLDHIYDVYVKQKEWARLYWKGCTPGQPNNEILYSGEYKIMRAIK